MDEFGGAESSGVFECHIHFITVVSPLAGDVRTSGGSLSSSRDLEFGDTKRGCTGPGAGENDEAVRTCDIGGICWMEHNR